MKVDQASVGRFEVPNWDPVSQKKVQDALSVLGATLSDSEKMFGTWEEVDPVRHLIGTGSFGAAIPTKMRFTLPLRRTRPNMLDDSGCHSWRTPAVHLTRTEPTPD